VSVSSHTPPPLLSSNAQPENTMSTLKTHRFSAHQVSVSCSAGGEQQSDATPQVARGWARSPCRPLQEPILLLRWVCFRGGGLPNPDLARVEGGGGRQALRGASLAVWTTTPWTLPANLAVAVGPSVDYCVVESSVRACFALSPCYRGVHPNS
jgi:hypothetical protein